MTNISHYSKLKKAFQETAVLVVGDIILDLYISGQSTRISPEAPIPIVKVESNTYVLGGAANVANNLSTLGAITYLMGIIGNDAEGKIVKSLLKEKRINSTNIFTDKRPTTLKTRILCQQQQMIRIDREISTSLSPDNQIKFLKNFQKLCKSVRFKAIIISDYAKGCITPVVLKEIFAVAKKNKIPVVVDPKNHDFSIYKGATYIKPNLSETSLAIKQSLNGANEKDIELAGAKLLNITKSEGILISRNKYGMSLIKKKSNFHVTAKATEVSDVSGAGDTVLSVFTLGIAAGLSAEFSTELSNVAAGIVVQKHGTATVAPEEIFKAIDFSHQNKAMPRNELKHFIQMEQALGNKIVFTNGCFDLLHVGHVKLLEESKKQGNILVVAINSDKSVKKLKGNGRPLINQDDRAKLLLSLSCVDYVVIFDEETPRPLLKLLKPDILVKGGDYTHHQVVGWEIVESYGGKITTIDLVKGKSTTKTLHQILEKNIKLS
jgi:D-beta-D-heptose 7-phosphate kinase/D-beta-D-heptose 1-phosphate adenosyltransferase